MLVGGALDSEFTIGRRRVFMIHDPEENVSYELLIIMQESTTEERTQHGRHYR